MPPAFVFAIPLKPKSASSDWRQVEKNLRRTIRSARASDPAAPVIVACHDEPELGDVADGVVVLRVPFPEPALSGYRAFGGAVVDTARTQAQLSNRLRAVRS